MTQLRHDIAKFKAVNTEVMVMVPNGPFMIKRYLRNNPTPYIILSDKRSQVAGQYFQVKQLFSLGTPSVFVVDQEGRIAYAHYADSLIEEPGNEEPLAVLAQLTA